MSLSGIKNIITTEPVLIAGAVQAVLALLAGTVLTLTAAESGAILAATTAALALAAAAWARPFQVSALTGFVSAVVTLLVAFGVHGVQPSIVSTLNAAIVAVAVLILRGHVTPLVTLRKQAAALPLLTATVGQVPQVDTGDLARKLAAELGRRVTLAGTASAAIVTSPEPPSASFAGFTPGAPEDPPQKL